MHVAAIPMIIKDVAVDAVVSASKVQSAQAHERSSEQRMYKARRCWRSPRSRLPNAKLPTHSSDERDLFNLLDEATGSKPAAKTGCTEPRPASAFL